MTGLHWRNGRLLAAERIESSEDGGEVIVARWFDLGDPDAADGPGLSPAGLKELLPAARAGKALAWIGARDFLPRRHPLDPDAAADGSV